MFTRDEFFSNDLNNIHFQAFRKNGIITLQQTDFIKDLKAIRKENQIIANPDELEVFLILWTDDYNPTLNKYYSKYS